MVFLIHYLVHPHRNRWLVQVGLLILSVACGCYIVDSVNRAGYYAVMKKTPPLGTLWVWAVVEMDVWLDVLSCAIVGIFTWWGEYNVL